ncbi:MAG: transglutaminase-like domain-containing protein [Candidatus Eremiobacteraeota bacterium]|nr:transglutaminase-like domain-containing protein [Candidatus Eremiobacteraeota bacterium]
MKKILFYGAALAVLFFAAAPRDLSASGIGPGTLSPEEGEYAVYYGKELAGQSRYTITEESTPGAKPLLRVAVDSSTSALVRIDQRIEFSQELRATLAADTCRPMEYTIKNSSPFVKEETVMRFGERAAEVRRATEGATVERKLPYEEVPFITDLSSPSGGTFNVALLTLLVRQKKLLESETLAVKGLAAGAFAHVELLFTREGTETLGGRQAMVYRVKEKSEGCENAHRLFIAPDKGGTILRMESPSLNYSYVKEKARRVLTPPDIGAAFALSIPFDVKNCASLRAKIALKVLGEATGKEKLARSCQSFEGAFQDGVLQGTLSSRSISLKTLPRKAFPCEYSQDLVKQYCQPEFLVESDDSLVAAKARDIVKGAATVGEATGRLGAWVYEQVAFAYTGGSAKATLIAMKGDWVPRTRLFIALLRSAGIPARSAGGLLVSENIAGNYLWAEAYLGEEAGWVPFDVAMGQVEYFSANHLTLWTGGMWDPYTFKPQCSLVEYREEPRPKGTKFTVK